MLMIHSRALTWNICCWEGFREIFCWNVDDIVTGIGCINYSLNTYMEVTVIEETPMAIQNSMKFLWKILWAWLVPCGLPLYMAIYLRICRTGTWNSTDWTYPGNKKKISFLSPLLNYFAVCPRCLDSTEEWGFEGLYWIIRHCAADVKSSGKEYPTKLMFSHLFATALGYS
jgi:hypothetical protein